MVKILWLIRKRRSHCSIKRCNDHQATHKNQKGEKSMSRQRLNLNCNFRAPDNEWFQVWQEFKEATRTKGLDICFVVLAFCRAWLQALNNGHSTVQIKNSTQIIFLCQNNTFQYNVHKPRRERFQRAFPLHLGQSML